MVARPVWKYLSSNWLHWAYLQDEQNYGNFPTTDKGCENIRDLHLSHTILCSRAGWFWWIHQWDGKRFCGRSKMTKNGKATNEHILMNLPFLDLMRHWRYECGRRCSHFWTVLGDPGSVVWCGSPSHRYFCTTEIGYPVSLRSLIPLAKTLNYMRGDDRLEEIQIGSKLTEI